MEKFDNFQDIAALALIRADILVRYLCPHGKRAGHEWVTLNPTRFDTKQGSFKINLKTGKWGDFATGGRGGDLIALWAYIKGTTQYEALRELHNWLGRAC